MRTPYSYGYSSDPSFHRNRPGLELYRGPTDPSCVACGPGGTSNRGAIQMAGITPVPSGTYMGPVGKIVLSGAGMRGYGYSSGPGIPDAVALESSPTARAMGYMSNLGIATRGQRGVLRLAGVGLGDGTQDREMCRGIFSAVGAIGSGARDINATTADGQTTRDQGWNQAGTYIGAGASIGGAFCNLIQTGQTPVQQQPTGTTMPPGYTYPPTGYQQPTPGPQAASSGLPSWAIPAGIAAIVAVAGAVILLK